MFVPVTTIILKALVQGAAEFPQHPVLDRRLPTSAGVRGICTADPVAADPIGFDSAFPPELQPVRFEIAGSRVNGVFYMAAGRGPHPIVIMLQGFPGNEKNADLSQAMRRAGTNVVNFNYLGTWGSQGIFTLENAVTMLAADGRGGGSYRLHLI